jgi:uncharacterized protein YjcR
MSEQLSETIYDRIRRETAKHHAAFWTWYELERNYDQTKTKLRVAPNTLAAWIKHFDWHERADKLDAKAQSIIESKAINERAKRQAQMSENHYKLGNSLLLAGGTYLQKNGLETGAQAIMAVKTGVEIQRKAEGLPDWLIKIAEMSEDELTSERDRLLNELAASCGRTRFSD